MRLCALSILSSLVLFCLELSSAIYADEAYQIDYQHALLGVPQFYTTFFHRPSANSKASLLYTLSESGIVGAKNPKDGTILWRQRIGEEGQTYAGKGFLKAGENSNVIYSALGGKLDAWDAVDGRLAWSWQGEETVRALEIRGQGSNDALIVTEGRNEKVSVRCFSSDTGRLRWEYTDASGDAPYSLIAYESRLFYVALHSALLKGSKIRIHKLDAETGEQTGSPFTFNSESEVSSATSILFAGAIGGHPSIAWADKTLKYVKVASLLKKQTSTLGALTNGEPIETISMHPADRNSAKPHFLLKLTGTSSSHAKVYHLDANTGTAKKEYDLPPISGPVAYSTSTHDENVYFVQHSSSDVSLLSSISPTVLQGWKIPPKAGAQTTDLRSVSHAVAEVVSRGGTKFSVRSALTLESGDLEVIRNGESLWVTSEGLTGVVAAAFVDLTKDDDRAQDLALEGQSNFVSAYIHRLTRHMKELQNLFVWMMDRYDGVKSGEASLNQNANLLQDRFGFNKVVIIATRSGRLAAVSTGMHGKVIWNIQAVTLEPGINWDVMSIDAEDDTALIRAAQGEFLRVESATGKILHHQGAGLLSGLKTTIPVLDAQGRQALLPTNLDGSLGDIPLTSFEDGTIVVTKDDDGTIKGWNVAGKGKVTQAWRFTPFPGQSIYDVNHRPTHDPVTSIGKVLGDRNVLYKYLNPNLILMTCTNTHDSSVTFYLLDSTSGAILHSIKHPDVDLRQPISSTISGNSFAYSLFSRLLSHEPLQLEPQKLQGYQLVVSEIFESPFPNDRGPLNSATNYSSRQPFIADDEKAVRPPHVISQTFFIPGPISRMSTTSTLQGITTRSLLCIAPHTNSLVAFPGQMLDPRRPVGRDPTPAEMEEGLFRYNAVLDFDGKWTLNHKRETLGLSHVIAAPSQLESTTLVFAYGDADLFGTRSSPIGGFDILGKGFSKLQLVGTVAALAVGTMVLAPLVRKKQIDSIWKA
ncbi:MAG: hypothetical protein OHK93_004845 [Ramalina farinacea]|uniref:ER membrane protein complex subunit 1 n=1 Tax=Ramalina farinacea TaxID=258253 RepID=A0AA43QXA0_9LECA|nr:hypothetical protein [Ramalina farinacea]